MANGIAHQHLPFILFPELVLFVRTCFTGAVEAVIGGGVDDGSTGREVRVRKGNPVIGADVDGSSVALVGGSVDNGTPSVLRIPVGTTDGTIEGNALMGCGVVGVLVAACVLSIRTT